MTSRFTIDAPLASADTWAGRQHGWRYRKAYEKWVDKQRKIEAIEATWCRLEATWRANMKRRDQASREYGEPETPHEFYAGRPGSQAEKIVLDCLCELRAISEADRLYAHELTDAISAIYLDLAWCAPRQRDAVKIHRRTMQLMRISAGEKE